MPHNIKNSISTILSLIHLVNQYINNSEFWKKQNRDEQLQIIGIAAESLKILSILLYPIIPKYSETLFKYFGLSKKDVVLENCKLKFDNDTILKYKREFKNELFIRKLKHR